MDLQKLFFLQFFLTLFLIPILTKSYYVLRRVSEIIAL